MVLKTNSHSAVPFVLEGVGPGSPEEREAGKLHLGYCAYLGLDVATMARTGAGALGHFLPTQAEKRAGDQMDSEATARY